MSINKISKISLFVTVNKIKHNITKKTISVEFYFSDVKNCIL